MILPLDYVKSFEDHRKQKNMVHSQKILKNRVRKVLPNDASIKLFYSQHGKSVNQSSLMKLYNFDEIPKSEYERNDRNLRMFRFYLIKNNYFDQRTTDKTKLKALTSRKASLISNEQKLMDYQFKDKTKLNYQEPWKYIDSTIKNMQAQSKGITLSANKSSMNQTKSSILIQLSDSNRKFSNQHNKSSRDSPKIAKSLSTSFIFKIKERERNASKIKDSLFIKELERSNSLRVNFHSKILESEVRVKKITENHSLEKRRINSSTQQKAQKCQFRKLNHEKVEPQIKKHLSELRKICIKNAYNKSESMSKLAMSQFVPVTKLKQIRVKQKREALKNILLKRLGIQDSPLSTKTINPEAQTTEKL